jgi:hypothetical protein
MIKELTELDFIITALQNIAPSCWVLRGDTIIWNEETAENITWDIETPPSKYEIELEILRVKQEYNSVEYQRLRQLEYPPLADLADALYWQTQGDESKMTAYLAAVAAVKSKYPKE